MTSDLAEKILDTSLFQGIGVVVSRNARALLRLQVL
jgi:hypothetical protein